MPLYKNDLENSPILRIVTCISTDAPSIAVEYHDEEHDIIDGKAIIEFIDKYTISEDQGIKRRIGPILEEKLRAEFAFLLDDK